MSGVFRSGKTLVWDWLLPILVPALLVCLVVYGLHVLDERAREKLQQSERYDIPLASIECPTPPGMTRLEFLREMQYLADLPDDVNALDRSMVPRLVRGFLKHPWVRRVDRIEVTPDRSVRVHLTFREPLLVVRSKEIARVIDTEAILLPPTAESKGLPEYRDNVDPPQGQAGTVWGDDRVLAVVKALVSAQSVAGLKCKSVSISPEGIVFHTDSGTKIIWGQAPGAEKKAEPKAEAKAERLKQYFTDHTEGTTLPDEIDLRLLAPDPVEEQ